MASNHYFLLFVVLKILITFVYTTDYSSEGYYSDLYDEYAEKEYGNDSNLFIVSPTNQLLNKRNILL